VRVFRRLGWCGWRSGGPFELPFHALLVFRKTSPGEEYSASSFY